MLVKPLEIPEVLLITPQRFADKRGSLSETCNRRRLAEFGIHADFVQDSHSFSSFEGVVHGLHFQIKPHDQGKLVRVTRGSVFDVALDLRHGSPTCGRHVSAIPTAENWAQLWIPVGFAHGFCTLEPDTEVFYKTTAYYALTSSHGIRWDDAALGIRWPVDPQVAILSDADRSYPHLAGAPAAFEMET